MSLDKSRIDWPFEPFYDTLSNSEEVDDDSIAKLGLLSAVSVPGRIMDESENPDVWKMGKLSASKMSEIEARLEVLLGIA